ncbi:zinc finger protein [Saccharopolyspora shandongensis]|uniref:zinc finger protein n=1 Tax=Saccharopolyspora shandongensis TaxID=418495 RepID=UPI0033CC6F8D
MFLVFFLDPQRPVAYWRPFEGSRHGLEPDEPPVPGQERSTLCGRTIGIVRPTEVEWLAPTCESCWSEAKARRDAAG